MLIGLDGKTGGVDGKLQTQPTHPIKSRHWQWSMKKNCYQICYQEHMVAKANYRARPCTGQPLMHLLVDDSIIQCAFLVLCTIGAALLILG